jgi:hypothetical protein
MSESFNAYYMLGSICWFSAAFFFYNIQRNYGTKSSLKTSLFLTGTSLALTAFLSHFPTILFLEMFLRHTSLIFVITSSVTFWSYAEENMKIDDIKTKFSTLFAVFYIGMSFASFILYYIVTHHPTYIKPSMLYPIAALAFSIIGAVKSTSTVTIDSNKSTQAGYTNNNFWMTLSRIHTHKFSLLFLLFALCQQCLETLNESHYLHAFEKNQSIIDSTKGIVLFYALCSSVNIFLGLWVYRFLIKNIGFKNLIPFSSVLFICLYISWPFTQSFTPMCLALLLNESILAVIDENIFTVMLNSTARHFKSTIRIILYLILEPISHLFTSMIYTLSSNTTTSYVATLMLIAIVASLSFRLRKNYTNALIDSLKDDGVDLDEVSSQSEITTTDLFTCYNNYYHHPFSRHFTEMIEHMTPENIRDYINAINISDRHQRYYLIMNTHSMNIEKRICVLKYLKLYCKKSKKTLDEYNVISKIIDNETIQLTKTILDDEGLCLDTVVSVHNKRKKMINLIKTNQRLIVQQKIIHLLRSKNLYFNILGVSVISNQNLLIDDDITICLKDLTARRPSLRSDILSILIKSDTNGEKLCEYLPLIKSDKDIDLLSKYMSNLSQKSHNHLVLNLLNPSNGMNKRLFVAKLLNSFESLSKDLLLKAVEITLFKHSTTKQSTDLEITKFIASLCLITRGYEDHNTIVESFCSTNDLRRSNASEIIYETYPKSLSLKLISMHCSITEPDNILISQNKVHKIVDDKDSTDFIGSAM